VEHRRRLYKLAALKGLEPTGRMHQTASHYYVECAPHG
jgi:hypothetical protein